MKKVTSTGGVIVRKVDSQPEVLLIRDLDYEDWFLPKGHVETGESLETTALREIEEETGLTVSIVEKINQFYPLSGCSTEKDFLFIAKVEALSSELKVKKGQDDESVTEMKFVNLGTALGMIDNGQITDTFTCNALQILARKIQLDTQVVQM